jgi:3-hydroxy-9,10-secoandrosta-1,3,5(10)-triene-9,17-dione monooxygenase reductase component
VASGDELRSAMRRFPSGIAVLTVPVPYGVTVGSLTSLSLEPALVGVSIGRDAQAHELLRDAGGFALSVLAGDQAALAQHFARSVPPIAQWEGIAVREGARGPLLDGAVSWIECSLHSQHDTGDHTYFVGAVERIELGRDGPGLVYRDGRYVAA